MRATEGERRPDDGERPAGQRTSSGRGGGGLPPGALLVVLLLATVGCHAYRPVDGEPAPGRTVRVTVDTALWSGSPGGAGTLTGDVASTSRDSLRLLREDRSARPGAVAGPGRDTLVVPYSAATGVEYRTISVWRSAAVAAGVLGATALTFEVASSGGVLSSPGEEGDGPRESIILRVPLGAP